MARVEDPDELGITLPDGRWLAYRSYGDPDGSPVAYHHGGLSAHTDVAFADEAARRHHLRLLAVDRPGTGESARLARRRVIDWGNDVATLMDALGIGSFSVLGWSAGGPYALACCRALGPRIRRAATVGGMCPFGPTVTPKQLGLRADRLLFPLSQRSRVLAAAIVRASSLLPERSAQRLVVRSLSSSEDRAVVSAMAPAEFSSDLRLALRHGPGGIVDDYVVLGGDWGFAPEEVTVPVCVFQGTEDTLLPVAHAESLAASLPHGRLEMIEGAGHFLLHRHLEAVFDALG
jgi:pimeloyl-ACP methyl ester carboxylesterase